MIYYKKLHFNLRNGLLLFFLLCNASLVSSQTKIEKNSYKSGSFIKFKDYSLQPLLTAYSKVEMKIRIIENSGINNYFLRITKKGKSGDQTASIAYEDLLEINEVFKILKVSEKADVQSNAEYLENKFITKDQFQLGYYLSNSKTNWYISLGSGSGNTFFPKKPEAIERFLNEAIIKIDELKN